MALGVRQVVVPSSIAQLGQWLVPALSPYMEVARGALKGVVSRTRETQEIGGGEGPLERLDRDHRAILRNDSDPICAPAPAVLTRFPHHACAASCAKSGRFPPGAPTIDYLARMKPCSDDALKPTDRSGRMAWRKRC